MPTSRTRLAVVLPLLSLAAVTTAATAGPASAADRVVKTGSCSAASDWKFKASHDDGRIEVEFEVDSNRVGQAWNWRITDNGALVSRGTARTTAPSGSFTVQRRTADRAGIDLLQARAVNPANGETCTATIRI